MNRLLHIVFSDLQDALMLSQKRLQAMALVGIVTFPLFYFIWRFFEEPYENLPLRVVGMLFCAGLGLHRHWPRSLYRRFFLTYFIVSGIYIFPFFFTYMMLANDFSRVWLLSLLTAVFILNVGVNITTSVLMFVLGTAAAFGAFFMSGHPFPGQSLKQYGVIAPIFAFAYVVSSIVSYRNDLIRREKDRTLAAHAAHLSHELKRPLSGILVGLEVLRAAHDRRDNVSFELFWNRAVAEVREALELFEFFLHNADPDRIEKSRLVPCRMHECIFRSLQSFPFHNAREHLAIKWKYEASTDYEFLGNEVLTVYALYNLYKNALEAISKSETRVVEIQTAAGEKYNSFTIRDSGPGIRKEHQKQVFKRFFTTASDGSGLGLFYVKHVMHCFGGRIVLKNGYGGGAEFTLLFPTLRRAGKSSLIA